jgi:hypothetical protein
MSYTTPTTTADNLDRFDAWSNQFDVLHTPALPSHYVVRMRSTSREYLMPHSNAALPSGWDDLRPYHGHYNLEPIPTYARPLHFT